MRPTVKNPVLGLKGMSLIELLFSVFVATLIMMGVFSYFSDSVRGVAHSEDSLKTVEEIGRITRQLRYDLSEIRPFQGPNGESIDLYQTPESFPIHRRDYAYKVFETNASSSSEIKVDRTEKEFRRVFKDDKIQYLAKRRLDSWFDDRPIHGGGHLGALEDGFVSFPVKLREHPGVKIRDHYLFSGGKKILYRHYGAPFNYVGLYEMDSSGNPVEITLFGKNASGEGRIPGFSMEPIFEFVLYPVEYSPEKKLDFLRYFLQIKLEFQGSSSGTGPMSRRVELEFSVMSPFLNGQKFHRGRSIQ